MNTLLDALGYAGQTLDKPGAAVRGLLAGRPDQLRNLIPFSDTLGITDPSQRTSGRDLLEQSGVLGAKEGEDFDLGDLAGMGAEVATDPMNYLGGALLKGLMGRRAAAVANNTQREVALAAGGMPEEVAALTKAVDEAGNPLRTYHGTPHVFDQYDLAKTGQRSRLGEGIYTADNPEFANIFTTPADTWENFGKEFPANVRMQHLDIRNPLYLDQSGAEQLRKVADAMPEYPRGHMPPPHETNDLVEWLDTVSRHEIGQEPREFLKGLGFDGIRFPESTLGTPADIWMAFDPAQVYAPYLAPNAKRVPRMSPLLAALAGHNLGARVGGVDA